MSSDRSNLTDFVYFRKLPPEVRLKIWRHAIFVPRDIFIIPVDQHNDLEDALRCTNYVPSLLHVNHEARSFGLKKYTEVFLCYDWPIISNPKDGFRETFDDTGYPDEKYIQDPIAEAEEYRTSSALAKTQVFTPRTPRIYMHPSFDRLVIMGDPCEPTLGLERIEAVLHKYRICRVAFPLHIYNDYDWLDNRMPRWGILSSFGVREIAIYYDQYSSDIYDKQCPDEGHRTKIHGKSSSAGDEGWVKGETSPFNGRRHDKYHFDQLDPTTHVCFPAAKDKFGLWFDQNDPNIRLLGQLLWAKHLIQSDWVERLENDQYLRINHQKERASVEYKEFKSRGAETVAIDDHMTGVEGPFGFQKNGVSACEIKLLRLIFERRTAPQKKVEKIRLVLRRAKGKGLKIPR